MPYTTQQVIYGIFAKLSDNYSFDMHQDRFIKFFYRRNRANCRVLRGIPFDKYEQTISSEEIDNAFDSLKASGLVTPPLQAFSNPHTLNTQAMRLGFDKNYRAKFDEEELEELEKLAKEFEQVFPRK